MWHTDFKRIIQGTGPLKDYVGDFVSKRDEASAAGATIAEQAARDISDEGLATAGIKQELWTKLEVDALEMTCAQITDRALRLDANIATAHTYSSGQKLCRQSHVAQPSGPAPRPPGACFECGSTTQMFGSGLPPPVVRRRVLMGHPAPPNSPSTRPPGTCRGCPPACRHHPGPAAAAAACIAHGAGSALGKAIGRLTGEMRVHINAEGESKWCTQSVFKFFKTARILNRVKNGLQ